MTSVPTQLGLTRSPPTPPGDASAFPPGRDPEHRSAAQTQKAIVSLACLVVTAHHSPLSLEVLVFFLLYGDGLYQGTEAAALD